MEGGVDIAVLGTPPGPALKWTTICQDSLFLASPPEVDIGQDGEGQILSPDEIRHLLAKYMLIQVTSVGGYNEKEAVPLFLSQYQLNVYSSVYVSDVFIQQALVEQGTGIAVVPGHARFRSTSIRYTPIRDTALSCFLVWNPVFSSLNREAVLQLIMQ